jgi:hypothetical protein
MVDEAFLPLRCLVLDVLLLRALARAGICLPSRCLAMDVYVKCKCQFTSVETSRMKVCANIFIIFPLLFWGLYFQLFIFIRISDT